MNKLWSKKLLLFVGGCTLLIVIMLSIQHALSAPKPSLRVERLQNEIATLEARLRDAQSEIERQTIQEQLEQYYQMATLVVTAQPTITSTLGLVETRRAHVTQRHITMVAFATLSYQRLPTGIIEDAVHAFFLPKDFEIGNAWYYKMGNRLIQVYAGADGKDPEQGAVIVNVAADHSIGMFLTPTRHGLVRIIEAKDFTLILEAEDGTIFYFNVLGRKYTSTVDEIVPTVTPESTVTPTPFVSGPYPTP